MNPGRNNLLTTLIDTFFPRRCPGCGLYDTWACKNCIITGCNPVIEPWPEAIDFSEPRLIEQHVSIGLYNTSILETVMDLYKFHRATELADTFAELLAPGVSELIANGASDSNKPIILLPVPLHPRRIRERGFDQNALLAKRLAEEAIKHATQQHVSYRTDLVVRTRHTAHQTTVAANERSQNLEDAFSLTSTAATMIPDATVLLIDDIVTTGATLNTLAKTLAPMRPAHIHAASILRSEKKRV